MSDALRNRFSPIAVVRRALPCAVALATALSLPATPAKATTHIVDVNGGGDFLSLAGSFHYVTAGDTVLVYPGVYSGPTNVNLTCPMGDFVLMSRDGPEVTIIALEGQDGLAYTDAHTTATTIEGLTFMNTATRYGNYGIYAEDASCTIRNCIFRDNARVSLNGIGFKHLYDCSFSSVGAAVRGRDNGTITLRSCSFEDVETAVDLSDYGNPCETIVTNCDFNGGSSALHISTHGRVEVDSCSFTGSVIGAYPYSGAAVQLRSRGTFSDVRITNCVFSSNYSSGSAGAIAINPGWMSESTSAPIVIEDCVFDGNSANVNGGAVRTWKVRVRITGCEFRENTASEGGAVYVGDEDATGEAYITDCVFVGNEATKGGAIAAAHKHTEISGCEFNGNTAEMGGAVLALPPTCEISDCLFVGNRAYIWGGGVCALETWDLPGTLVESSTFDRNVSHRGSAFFLDASRGTIRNCTLYGGSSDEASLVCTRVSQLAVEKCISSFASEGTTIALQMDSIARVSNSVIFGNAGDDPLSDDGVTAVAVTYDPPLFCDAASGDFTLCADSFCLPANNPWSYTIGAHGQGCGECGTAVEFTTWGSIKAMFR